MNPQNLIENAKAFVRAQFKDETSGHDAAHVLRVWCNACRIAARERCDQAVVELAALLHDIADWKFHEGDLTAGPKAARQWLLANGADETIAARVSEVIAGVSFKGAKVKEAVLSMEAKIVQDADRLDAIGAIGIARCFAYGGHKGHALYDPEIKPVMHESAQSYIQSKGTSINHFYEKLLLLKDRMHTQTARAMAQERHEFMEAYLRRFLAEWNG